MNTSAPAGASFHAYGPSHLWALACTVVFTALMIFLARRRMERVLRPLEILVAAAIVLEWPASALLEWREGILDMGNALPLQLCAVAAVLGAVALVTRRQEACELLWFWGLAGTLQGLITPALGVDWPHPRFVLFFIVHGGIVSAAFHMVIGRRVIPRRGAVWRALGWLIVYAAAVGLIDQLLCASGHSVNYGFLCAKPPNASILDMLGPWPWYIGPLMLLSFVFFTLLDLPFVFLRRRNGGVES